MDTTTKTENIELIKFIEKTKYLQEGESWYDCCRRVSKALSDSKEHEIALFEILFNKRFLFAGRILTSIGTSKLTTAGNCYVSGTIHDSMHGIMKALEEAAATLRMGGGIGYDFSTLRPSGSLIHSLKSTASGPVGNADSPTGFMDIFDATCGVIMSQGHRRGAQMGVLRVDHPDILHFIRAKRQPGRLTRFNVSVGITDKFMKAVENKEYFDLVFNGYVYNKVYAPSLWDEIIRSTWDYAEPGVLFLDTINRMNNLYYIEEIAATNPCGEQPLPPYGACFLGSFVLPNYIVRREDNEFDKDVLSFSFKQLMEDIPHVVRAMDNVIDQTNFPLGRQKDEALNKRRIGIGITGLANASEILGAPYGSASCVSFTNMVMAHLSNGAYQASSDLAVEKGTFPLYERDKYIKSNYIQTALTTKTVSKIYRQGVRNSHLISIAPTGTISLLAGNMSSGCEPPYTRGIYTRNVFAPNGTLRQFQIMDYAEEKFGITGITSEECSVEDHLKILEVCSFYSDSAVSKTCNVGDDVTFEEFKDVYMKAYRFGAKGCTTFRPAGMRKGIFEKPKEGADDETAIVGGEACSFNEFGERTCDVN